jgi:hypothetical protein
MLRWTVYPNMAQVPPPQNEGSLDPTRTDESASLPQERRAVRRLAVSTCIEPSTDAAAARAPTRVMRWTYACALRRYVCELMLDASTVQYAFRVIASTEPGSVVSEFYNNVAAAFRRQSQFEAYMVATGCSLEAFTVDEDVSANTHASTDDR